jgi:hypothetical protein
MASAGSLINATNLLRVGVGPQSEAWHGLVERWLIALPLKFGLICARRPDLSISMQRNVGNRESAARESARAYGHHRSAQARQTMPPHPRHYMTSADAPNAFDGPLAATKPLQDLTAEPTSNGARTRRVPPPAQSQPGAPSIIAACASKPALQAARPSPLTIAGAIRSP